MYRYTGKLGRFNLSDCAFRCSSILLGKSSQWSSFLFCFLLQWHTAAAVSTVYVLVGLAQFELFYGGLFWFLSASEIENFLDQACVLDLWRVSLQLFHFLHMLIESPFVI